MRHLVPLESCLDARVGVRRGILHFRCSTAVVCLGALAVAAPAADWPGFRGPGACGESSESGVFAGDAVGLKVAWKTHIGAGYSGVAVVGDRVVTAYAKDGKDRLGCFDAVAGKPLWSLEIEDMYAGHDGSHDGPIATPLIDGDRVFMLGARGRLLAASLSKGEVLWSTDLIVDHQAKAPFYGFGTSPLLLEGVLVVQVGTPGPMVLGLDPATGKKRWGVGEDEIAYQSPVIYGPADRRVVLAAGSKRLLAVDPAKGEVAWTFEHGGNGPRGSASLVPVPCGIQRLFLANKDDSATVIEPQTESAEASFNILWEGRQVRNSYNVPVFHDGHVYAYSARFLTCVDATTGEVKWKSRQPGDGFLSLIDGHLLVATKDGGIHIARATPSEFAERAATSVFEDVAWSHPSFANGSIYARSQGELARIDVVRGAAAAAAPPAREGVMPESKFGRFIASLSAETDKSAAVDRFLEKQSTFPIIEDDRIVHFVYRGEGTDLAVAGDMFGARQERPMHRADGTDLFYFSMPVEPDARLNYVFMRDYQTITDPKNSRTTVTTLVDQEMEMSFSGAETSMSWFAMPQWSPPQMSTAEVATAGGRMESHELESAALEKKHKVEVYLPAGYESGDRRYSAIYVFGGDAALKYGRMQERLDQMCGRGMPPAIAVFVNENSFRQQEKLPVMFADELVPFIDKTYRTVASAEGRAAIGAGFAGSDAWYCAMKQPKLVSRLGGQSMFIFDSFTPKIEPMFTSPSEQPLTIYLDWGKYDFRNPVEAWDMGETNRELAEALKGKGFRLDGGQVNDGSGWSSWSNRIDRMLTALFTTGS